MSSSLNAGSAYEKIMNLGQSNMFLHVVIKIVLDNLAFIWMKKKTESGVCTKFSVFFHKKSQDFSFPG